jgi:ribosomal-protein-alanine N-acetyltransferase
MIDQVEIYTDRLILRSITPQIINSLFRENTEEGIRAFFEVDENGFETLQSMYEQGMETNRISMFYFLLHDRTDNKIIGECGFHTWNRSHRRADLFYSIRDDRYKRRGLMTEAVSAVIEYGFTELGLHRIAALVAHYNEPSLRIIERFKFTKEGTMREDYVVDGVNEDSECYSLLKWEWM